ncbi:hypothetical protein, partial [Staphylococcus aureus]|uniref:hypothetical protein n=1 Tax=Staphylococcus aureus TaxID=1280 RepID=UPI0016428BD6
DTNRGGGQVSSECKVVEFEEDCRKGIVSGGVSDDRRVEDRKEYRSESNVMELVDELGEEDGEGEGGMEEISEN